MSDDAILRVHEKIRANLDRIPVGIPDPLIVSRGINDVAVVVLTLSPRPEAAARWTDKDLYALGEKLQAELVKTDNVGLTYISGGNPQQIRVEPDPEKLALFGVTLQQLVDKVRGANRSFQSGSVRDNDTHAQRRRRPDANRYSRHRTSARCHARQSSSLCARCGVRRHWPEPAGTPRLDGGAGAGRKLESRAGGQRRFCQALRRQCRGRRGGLAGSAEKHRGSAYPG